MATETNRLTESDIDRVKARTRETLENWRQGNNAKRMPRFVGTHRLALQRIAYNAIGCSSHDLRDSELAAVDVLILAELAAVDASLTIGHAWTNVACGAYHTNDPDDCSCAVAR